MDPKRITVLYGGPSAEREVSLQSGRAVAEALGHRGHDITLADITPDDLSALDNDAEVFFPVTHGTWGEDGQLQQLMEDRGVTYVGSGPEASALAMNKAATKSAFLTEGLPTPGWQVLGEWPGAWDGDLPVVVKPIDQGSTVDLFIPKTADALAEAVKTVCDNYGRCLIEQFIAGRELTVGVLGDRALPPVEIIVGGEHEFYDYQAKYQDDTTQYVANPKLPRGLSDELRELALAAFSTLGCRDYARVDFRLRDDGQPFLLEVNTLPGFTSHSLLPMGAAADGLDFATLCERLIEMALQRSGNEAGRLD